MMLDSNGLCDSRGESVPQNAATGATKRCDLSRYSFHIERGDENYRELEANYRRHYAEMTDRLEREGVKVSPYNPRLNVYFDSFKRGNLLNYVVRLDGAAVGHSNVYLTNDMHNGDLIAQEDMIYVVPEHRNGVGRKFTKYILADLKGRGVVRSYITAVTDPRLEKVWTRIGFKAIGAVMVHEMELNHVFTKCTRAA